MIAQERLKELFSYDPDTGIFRRLQSRGNRRQGDIAGSDNHDGYLTLWAEGRSYQCSRLAWLYMTGDWPSHEIDHIDGNRANNAWANLREATHAENCRNRRRRSDNKTGYPGISVTPNGKYRVRVGIDGERVFLGDFDTLPKAVSVRNFATRDLHGEFAA